MCKCVRQKKYVCVSMCFCTCMSRMFVFVGAFLWDRCGLSFYIACCTYYHHGMQVTNNRGICLSRMNLLLHNFSSLNLLPSHFLTIRSIISWYRFLFSKDQGPFSSSIDWYESCYLNLCSLIIYQFYYDPLINMKRCQFSPISLLPAFYLLDASFTELLPHICICPLFH